MICGSDNKTYDNICQFDCAKKEYTKENIELTTLYLGSCCTSSNCTMEEDFLCDNLGNTHLNNCFFSQAQCIRERLGSSNLTISHYGKCNGNVNDEVCNNNCLDNRYEPLCDNKNSTHDNYCTFKLFNCRLRQQKKIEREILYFGKCKEVEDIMNNFESTTLPSMVNYYSSGDSDYIPIKESQGVDLVNECSMVGCNDKWDPVCDTRNVTHKNECIFNFYQCKILKQDDSSLYDISIAHKGICGERKVYRKETDYNYEDCPVCNDEDGIFPVCDNRNVTFPTMCALAKTNCLRRLEKKEESILVHIGRCGLYSPIFDMKNEKCPSNCSKEYKPVCDTNDMTHPNLCIFQMYNCELRKRKNNDISWLKSLKACPERPIEVLSTTTQLIDLTTMGEVEEKVNLITCPQITCGNESSIICDSEGGIHKNECFFQKARCHAAQKNIVLRPLPDEMCGTEDCLARECDNDIDYVCGSDFKTYNNLCELERAKCKNKKLETLFIGQCERCFAKQCPVLQDSDDDDLFVCDQNAETRSRCEFEMLRCIYEIKYGYNITEAYNGRCCPNDDTCSFDHFPLCDSRGKTHKNMCFFEVEKCRLKKIHSSVTLTIVTEQSCEDYHKQLALSAPNCTNINDNNCGNDYEPVCGSDGQTYINSCDFNKKVCNSNKDNEIRRVYDGECCKPESECLLEWKPICDSNRVTHPNLCFYESKRCVAERKNDRIAEIDFYYPCNDNNCESIECPRKYEPVCGTNGKTYTNECFLNHTMCHLVSTGIELSNKLGLDYEGECCKTTESCPLTFTPVCDSTGTTHINECFFHRNTCKFNKKNNIKIIIEYNGECCKGECDKEPNDPVCDGENTYKNICYFRQKQCDLKKIGKDISISYYGSCCPKETKKCQEIGEVCDENGVIYSNICLFIRQQCISKKQYNKQLKLSKVCPKKERIYSDDSDKNNGTKSSSKVTLQQNGKEINIINLMRIKH
uniref:Agrin n=1 Tax=Parastrongyloides trichosuri TaxID=131310 RepID=A0A0N4ZIU7_PARTI